MAQRKVWDDLPQELMMRVLAHLPAPVCLRARTVCKYWRAVIDSPDFMRLRYEMWMERPWFLLYQRVKVESVFMYDPRDRQFYRLPLSFLPVPVCGRAAAGSLLCVEERAKGFFKALYVCDPVARTWIKLPPMMMDEPEENLDSVRSVTLTVEDSEFISAYKVYVSCNNQMQVYDSLSTSWQRLGQFPVWSSVMSSVLCANSLFTLSPTPGFEIVPQFYQLLKFSLDDPRREWRPVQVQMPCCLRSPHLAEHEGRILMVGKVYKRMSSSAIGESSSSRPRMVGQLKIWELNETSASWDLIGHVPPSLCNQLISGNWNTACAWNGEWICIASRDKVLSYNLRTRKWGLSPPSSSASSSNDHRSLDSDKPTLSLISSFRPTFRKGFLLSSTVGD